MRPPIAALRKDGTWALDNTRSSVTPPEIRGDTEEKGKHSKFLEVVSLPPNKTEAQNKTILYKKKKFLSYLYEKMDIN